jgi:hypothetical protein
MNRLVIGLTIAVVVLSFVNGFLCYQLNDVNALNSELRSQNADIQNQLDEQQIQNSEQETQITILQNRNNALQWQISEQQNETGELEKQLSEQQNINYELQNQTNNLQLQLGKVQDQLAASQNQTSYLQTQLGEQLAALGDVTYELALERPLDVLITKFEWTGSFSPLVGLTVNYSIIVTVQNVDVTALGGLSLSARFLKKDTLTPITYSHVFSTTIGNLKAGESRDLYCGILAAVGTITPDSAVCALRLTVNDIVLDERTYNLS